MVTAEHRSVFEIHFHGMRELGSGSGDRLTLGLENSEHLIEREPAQRHDNRGMTEDTQLLIEIGPAVISFGWGRAVLGRGATDSGGDVGARKT
jgi:hypothetical protein